MDLVYFSNVSNNTARFVAKLDVDAYRIPISKGYNRATAPYILVTPTYGGGHGLKGCVPKQVVRYLDDPGNSQHLQGVVSSGNLSFHEYYAIAGAMIAKRFDVPWLYRFEIMGTPDDVEQVQQLIKEGNG